MSKSYASIRLGETRRAKNGLAMTIIAYRRYEDMDIQFEDGLIVHHISYNNYLQGNVRHPSINARISSNSKNRLGETRMTTYGLEMTIIEYRNTHDIDVKFSNGTVLCHRSYYDFRNGLIRPYAIDTSRIGETNKASNGLMMTIIDYRGSLDLDVQFEDGVIVTNVEYSKFVSGMIRHPKINPLRKLDRIGEISLGSHGLSMQISDYVNVHNVTILFESGYSSSNKHYREFKSGRISHPFPYQIGNISMDKPAYIYNGVGNFYCHCTKCGLEDIMTVQEMREHICQQ